MVNQLDATIARLRLFLAEIEARERQVQVVRRQFRDQVERVISYALYRDGTLDQTLAMMADVEQRRRDAEELFERLGDLHARVEAELESLQLTKDVEGAKSALAELEARRARLEAWDEGSQAVRLKGSAYLSLEDITAEIRRLRTLINQASERAAQRVVSRKT